MKKDHSSLFMYSLLLILLIPQGYRACGDSDPGEIHIPYEQEAGTSISGRGFVGNFTTQRVIGPHFDLPRASMGQIMFFEDIDGDGREDLVLPCQSARGSEGYPNEGLVYIYLAASMEFRGTLDLQNREPDVLIKGSDWPEADIIGGDFVKKRGGRVVRIPIVDGVSTSAIIRRIVSLYGAAKERPS